MTMTLLVILELLNFVRMKLMIIVMEISMKHVSLSVILIYGLFLTLCVWVKA